MYHARVKSGIAAVLVLAACGGAGRAATPSAPVGPATTTSTMAADAGVLVLCVPDGKDTAPCAEECNRGIASSCEILADRISTHEPARAVALHERACDLRDPAACVAAARMHGAGRGVVPDRKRQVELLVAACNLGDTTSCSSAARALSTAAGVPQDDARARALWQRACLGGDASSCEDVESTP